MLALTGRFFAAWTCRRALGQMQSDEESRLCKELALWLCNVCKEIRIDSFAEMCRLDAAVLSAAPGGANLVWMVGCIYVRRARIFKGGFISYIALVEDWRRAAKVKLEILAAEIKLVAAIHQFKNCQQKQVCDEWSLMLFYFNVTFKTGAFGGTSTAC